MAALVSLLALVEAAVPWLLLASALLGFAIAAFGALAASCLAVYSPTKLQNRITDAPSDAAVRRLEQHESELRVVARFYLYGGLFGTFVALRSAVSAETLPWVTILLGVLAMFACGTLPAAVADARAETTLLRVLPLLRAGLRFLRWPLVLPLLGLTRLTMRLLRIRAEPSSDPEVIAEDVMAAVADSVTDDRLADQERAWITNIVGLKDLQVSTIMTPRPDIVAIKADQTVYDALQLALQHGFSRYPVYRERIDDITGVFFVKDALGLTPEESRLRTVQTIMRAPLFVPESMGTGQLLRRFQADKMHMAIVLDEYGTTTGVVSVEDVLEQIVGDIADEYDAADTATDDQIEVVEDGHVVDVPGRTSVEDVNRLLGTDLREDGDFETIAGLVIQHTNRIPTAEELLQIDGVEFRVLEADDRRIGRLRVTAPTRQAAPQNG